MKLSAMNIQEDLNQSREDHQSLSETIYILSSKINKNRLFDSIKQYKNGNTTSFTLDKLNREHN